MIESLKRISYYRNNSGAFIGLVRLEVGSPDIVRVIV